MPISKMRKKKGKKVQNNAKRRIDLIEQQPTGVTLQDLINMVAYQDLVVNQELEKQEENESEEKLEEPA